MNIKYNAVNISITVGNTVTSPSVNLREGTCIGVAFFPFAAALPEQNINIGVQTPQGTDLIEAVDVRDYLKGNSEHLKSYKQVQFKSKGDINVNVSTPVPIAGSDFTGQLVFAIVIEE